MARRSAGSTAALLQRANSQLKGEKIQRPEDELNAYISSLTQKTSQQKKSVNFEDLGDSISISSELEDAPYQARPEFAISSGASKFLKKKTPSTEPDVTPEPGGSKFLKKLPSTLQEVTSAPAGNKFLKKPQTSAISQSPAPSTQNRYGTQTGQGAGTRPGSQGSSALDKASALTGKIQQRAAVRRPVTIESDSDESFSAFKMARTTGEQISESLTTESVKIGRDGGKFLKKATPSPAPAQSFEPPLMSTQLRKGPEKTAKQEPKQKKASPFTLKSSLKYSTDVVLTSEEESLAEFVGGLPSSSGDSFEKPHKQAGRPSGKHSPSHLQSKPGRGHSSPSPPPHGKFGRHTPGSHGRSVSPQNRPPVIRRTPSPSPRTNGSPVLRRRSPSPKLIRSYSDDSNVAESIKSEIAEDFDIGVNTVSDSTPRIKKKVVIMDLDDLGPAVGEDLPSRPDTPQSSTESPYRATARKSEKEVKKPRKSALKSSSDTSLKDKKGKSSPFKATNETESSPFKSSSKNREKSPFKANPETTESPFKSSSKRDKSPFKAQESQSPFKAANKENQSPFKAANRDSDAPFNAKTGSSLFKASGGGSLFKASDKDSSVFKAGGTSKSNRDRSSSSLKAKDKSQKKSKNKKEKKGSKSKSKSKKNEASDLFSSFGLQTVEELFGGTSIKESEYESLLSEVDEVRSEITDEIKTERPSMYSYSQKFDDSETEIVSEVEDTKPSRRSYTEDVDSVSEMIDASTDRGQSSVSEVKTRYSGEESVPDYTEFSESDTTETEATYSRSEEEEDSERTYSDSYTTYTEEYTKSVLRSSRSDVTPRLPRGMMSAEVQTMEDGLRYSWDAQGSGMAFPGMPYGLGFVDPTPIATQVVSADALEAMTAYSPAMLALHDMLKSQYELTREFLDSQKRLYDDFSNNIKSTYHYTTLEDTKKYIKKHKKKRLTFKEALKLVDQEMER